MTTGQRTVPAVLERIALQFPDHDALISPDRQFTFSQLREEVRRAAAALIALGVAPGDRVAIWSPNTWHWAVACLAVHHAGAAMVPLNTRYTADEATDILARTKAPVLVAMGRFLDGRNDFATLHAISLTLAAVSTAVSIGISRCIRSSNWRTRSLGRSSGWKQAVRLTVPSYSMAPTRNKGNGQG